MNIEEKLTAFSNTVLMEANKQVMEVKRDIKIEIEKVCKEEKESLIRQSKQRIKHVRQRAIDLRLKQEYSSFSTMQKEVVLFRNELTSKIFDNVLAKLNAFVDTHEYKASITNKIDSLLKEYDGKDICIQIMDRDSDIVSKYSSKIKIIISEKNLIGGLIAIIKNKGLYIDLSFSSKFDREIDNFNEFSIV
jgi:vacuolar-type H+-ATPase subunit E/Vma4